MHTPPVLHRREVEAGPRSLTCPLRVSRGGPRSRPGTNPGPVRPPTDVTNGFALACHLACWDYKSFSVARGTNDVHQPQRVLICHRPRTRPPRSSPSLCSDHPGSFKKDSAGQHWESPTQRICSCETHGLSICASFCGRRAKQWGLRRPPSWRARWDCCCQVMPQVCLECLLETDQNRRLCAVLGSAAVPHACPANGRI